MHGSALKGTRVRNKERDFLRLLANLHQGGVPESGWLAAEPEATPQIRRLRLWGFPAVSPSHPRIMSRPAKDHGGV